MFGQAHEDADYYCPHCGRAGYFDVGFGPLDCSGCGGSLTPPPAPPSAPLSTANDDVLLDADYILFDEYKAFRLLKRLGLLEQCLTRFNEEE